MKKILLSLGLIAVVAIVSITATRAFFSDTETSTANVFTAGAIDLKVDSQQHYNNAICVDNKWALADEEAGETNPQYPVIGSDCGGTWGQDGDGLDIVGEKFFNFEDIKPGDFGENTISLHVINNDAWLCAAVSNLSSDDNGLTEPEAKVDTTDGAGNGELDNEMVWKVWRDDANGNGAVPGDNIWQDGEQILAQGNPTDGVLALYDSMTNTGPLTGAITGYMGVSWSLPASSGNETQTDSLTGDISFYTVQSRNNGTFRCSDWRPEGENDNQTVVVGADDLETSLANASESGKWYFYDDKDDVLNNSLGGFVVGPATPPVGTGSAVANPLATANSRTLLTNSAFGGTLLSDINAMSYSYYQPSGSWSVNEAPFLRFNVDLTGAVAYQGSLVYVPSSNGPVTQNSWQTTGNMTAPGALWFYSGANWPVGLVNPSQPAGPGINGKTWAQIKADYPNAKMHPVYAQIGMRVGEPGPAGLTANLDNFSITVGAVTKTFDFEN